MGTLSATITNMSSMFGTFRAPNDFGEVATIGEEMESVSAAMYRLSQKRMAVALDAVIPTMGAQFRRDVTHTAAWSSLKFDKDAAFGGVSNALYAGAATQLQAVRYGLPKYMSPSLQASVLRYLCRVIIPQPKKKPETRFIPRPRPSPLRGRGVSVPLPRGAHLR